MIVSDTHRLIVCPWCGRELPTRSATKRLPRHSRPDGKMQCSGSDRDVSAYIQSLRDELTAASQALRREKQRVRRLNGIWQKRVDKLAGKIARVIVRQFGG